MIDPNYFNNNLERLARLCNDPGWKAWAWHEAKLMEERDSQLTGLQQALKERMLKQKEAT